MTGVPLAVGAIVLLAATVQSATGFGYAVLAAPLLSIVVSPAQALPLVWLTFLPATVVLALSLRADACWAIGWRAGLAGVAGAMVGAWALAGVPSRALQALTGLSVLVCTLAHAGPRETPALATRITDVLGGVIAGVLAVTTGASGPPLVLAVSRHSLSPAQVRATLAWLFTAFALTTVTGLMLTGRVPAEARGLLPASVPPLAAGTALGSFAARHLPSRAIAIGTRLLLLASALACLTAAAR